MKKTVERIFAAVVVVLVGLLPSIVLAAEKGIDEWVNDVLSPVANAVAGTVFFSVGGLPLILVWLVVGAIFFTFYFNFINVRAFGHAIDLVKGKFSGLKDPGEVTHFQALSTALSATVGLGNSAGVAIAVSLGGPGATFWMILAGLLGMSSKFCECTLGVMYREIHADGSISGGPMYYLSKGLAERGMPGLGRIMAMLFAIMCIVGALGAGNMFQANQSFQQVLNITGGADGFMADKAWIFGVVLALIVGAVIIGGIKSIARVTEKLVPFMGVIYIIAAFIIIIMHIDQLPTAIGAIFSGAFSAEGVTGGIIGVLIQGFKRAAFSNEAGIGSAPIAHAAAKTKEPVSEGIVSLLEPFIDTVVICTMTALVIVITGQYQNVNGISGVQLTSNAFASGISWFPYVLAVAVILFAFSTLIAWSYYGNKAWNYLFGDSKFSDFLYKIIYCGFVVIGATMSLGAVIDFADSMIFAMALFNIAGLYLLAPVVKRELNSYWSRLESGEIRKIS
jgi:AGCS family alanine or glycine:cation symporter